MGKVHGQHGNTMHQTKTPSAPPLKPLTCIRLFDLRSPKLPAEGVPNGALPGSWKVTPANGRRNINLISGRNDLIHATPGAQHVKDLVYQGVSKTTIPSDSVVINEVRNDTSSENLDWVELYNAGTTAVDLNGGN